MALSGTYRPSEENPTTLSCSRAAPGDATVLLHGYTVAEILRICRSDEQARMDIGDWYFELS